MADRRPDQPHPALRIILAEDDPDLRGLIADELRDDGYDVTEVPDGGRMLVRIAQEYAQADEPRDAFDLIISDVYMPVCTGTQIVEGLRRAHWHTPVILMTARVTRSTRAVAESLGAILIAKPFDVQELKAAIGRLLHTA
jgi:DNA-binding response OmpR family regulator